MMALGIVGGAVSLLPLGRLSDKVDRRLVIAGAMLAGALVALITGLVPVSAVPVMMFLFGV
jgi:MFS family permease